jgi:hypothetical protein
MPALVTRRFAALNSDFQGRVADANAIALRTPSRLSAVVVSPGSVPCGAFGTSMQNARALDESDAWSGSR